jgi:hypothetical protein
VHDQLVDARMRAQAEPHLPRDLQIAAEQRVDVRDAFVGRPERGLELKHIEKGQFAQRLLEREQPRGDAFSGQRLMQRLEMMRGRVRRGDRQSADGVEQRRARRLERSDPVETAPGEHTDDRVALRELDERGVPAGRVYAERRLLLEDDTRPVSVARERPRGSRAGKPCADDDPTRPFDQCGTPTGSAPSPPGS